MVSFFLFFLRAQSVEAFSPSLQYVFGEQYFVQKREELFGKSVEVLLYAALFASPPKKSFLILVNLGKRSGFNFVRINKNLQSFLEGLGHNALLLLLSTSWSQILCPSFNTGKKSDLFTYDLQTTFILEQIEFCESEEHLTLTFRWL